MPSCPPRRQVQSSPASSALYVTASRKPASCSLLLDSICDRENPPAAGIPSFPRYNIRAARRKVTPSLSSNLGAPPPGASRIMRQASASTLPWKSPPSKTGSNWRPASPRSSGAITPPNGTPTCSSRSHGLSPAKRSSWPAWAPSGSTRGNPARIALSPCRRAVLDFMFWPGGKHKFGWFLEPAFDYSFARGHEKSLSISGGLLIAIP